MVKCKNCEREKKEHYVSINSDRKQKLKNIALWCYSLNKSITPTDKRYMMIYEEDSQILKTTEDNNEGS